MCCTFLVTFIPKYFLSLIAILNEVSPSDWSLCVREGCGLELEDSLILAGLWSSTKQVRGLGSKAGSLGSLRPITSLLHPSPQFSLFHNEGLDKCAPFPRA